MKHKGKHAAESSSPTKEPQALQPTVSAEPPPPAPQPKPQPTIDISTLDLDSLKPVEREEPTSPKA